MDKNIIKVQQTDGSFKDVTVTKTDGYIEFLSKQGIVVQNPEQNLTFIPTGGSYRYQNSNSSNDAFEDVLEQRKEHTKKSLFFKDMKEVVKEEFKKIRENGK